MTSLLHTKKMFVDTYGEVPPMIGFLGIDTNENEFQNFLMSARGEKIVLEPNECLQISVDHAVDTFRRYRRGQGLFTWMPEKNEEQLRFLDNHGAGQIRSNGRFAATIKREDIARNISDKLNDITNAQIIDNKDFILLANAVPEVHMVFSVCGGTGSGSFLNVAYLIREFHPECEINGYAVLPGVFHAMAFANKNGISPNAYGCLVDLDYIIHKSFNGDLNIEYPNNQTYRVEDDPFDSIILVDNKNDNNDVYDHVDKLAEMISLALVSASGALTGGLNSVGSNFAADKANGFMDVVNKKAWAAGMGASEIVYRGNQLSELYSVMASINLIERLMKSTIDANAFADAWIESEDVRIRENNNNDQVIDSICAPTPIPLTINRDNYQACAADVDTNIRLNLMEVEPNAVSRKVNDIINRVREQLATMMRKQLNAEGGLVNTRDILVHILSEVELCLDEMRDEKVGNDIKGIVGFEKKLDEFSAELKTAKEDLQSYKRPLIGGARGVETRAVRLEGATFDYVQCKLEIVRRDAAMSVYNSVITEVTDALAKVKAIINLFNTAKDALIAKVALLKRGGGNMVFQINLADDDIMNIAVANSEVSMEDFIASLEGEDKIFAFDTLKSSAVVEKLNAYTIGLSAAKKYKNKSVNDVLEQIYAQDKENGTQNLENIIKRAIGKSMPLFRYDYHGALVAQEPSSIYFVGVDDHERSILNTNGLFKKHFTGTPPSISFISTGMKDKVIIYRQVGVLPLYALKEFGRYQLEFENPRMQSRDYFFDAQMCERRSREGYDVYPAEERNFDVLSYWVKGFVYGLFKYEGGAYYVRSKSLGENLQNPYYRLDEWRDRAYEEFERNIQTLSTEFEDYIKNQITNLGQNAINDLQRDAYEHYWDKYSLCRLSDATLRQRGYEETYKLKNSELNYVNTWLSKS